MLNCPHGFNGPYDGPLKSIKKGEQLLLLSYFDDFDF